MRHIYLVTHPEAQHHVDGIVGGWHDSELTARGRLQAERIAEVLASRIGPQPVEVYSSDLSRASQTAKRIARRFFVEVQTDARLRERSNGEADGRPQAWLAERVFFPLTSGGITTLLRNDTHFSHQVVSLNETQHLQALEEPPPV